MNSLFGVFALIALSFALTNVFAQNKAEIDKPAPYFELTDVNGVKHKLSDFRGKYVVLEWINFNCPFVKKHYDSKNMQKLQDKYTQQGVIWLAICSSAPGKEGHLPKDEIKKRSENYKTKFTAYLIDESGDVGRLYSAKTTPHMYIIDPQGTLIYAGAIDSIRSTDKADIEKAENYVSKALGEALAGKPVSTKVTQPYGCSVKY